MEINSRHRKEMVVKPLKCRGFVCDLLYEIIVTSCVVFSVCKSLEGDGLPNIVEENVNNQYLTDFLYCFYFIS